MPLQSETVFLLSTVPGDVAYPIAAAAGAAMTAMGKAIVTLYKNGRQDSIDSISALKDSASALRGQATALHKQTEILDKVAVYLQEDGRKHASGG